MSNNALPLTSLYLTQLLFSACVLAFWMPPTLSWAQSREALEAVRFHHRDARQQVQAELDRCARKCESARGLSLLAGYLNVINGEPERAATQLKSQPAPPGLETFRIFYLAEALYQTQSYKDAAEFFQQALDDGLPVLEARTESRLGLALEKDALYDSALHHLGQAIAFRATAELLSARARAHQATDNPTAAELDWRYVAVHFPTDALAKDSTDVLTARRPGVPIFSLDERLTRAQGFAEAGQFKAALEELSLAEAQKLISGSAQVAKVALARAQIQYGLGDETQAERELKRAVKGPPAVAAEALMLRAKRTLRTDDLPKTRAQMAAIDRKFPRQPQGDEAGFLVGWLDMQARRFVDAVKSFDTFQRRHPRSTHTDEARWFKSLAFIRLQRFAEAHTCLEKLVRRFPRSSLIPQARYWEVRADQLAGKPFPSLADSYREIARAFPGSFYSFLAQRRLREHGEEAPLSFLPLTLKAKPEIPDRLRLAVLLSRVGLFRDAGDEMHRRAAAIRDVNDAAEWGLAFQQLGEYGHAYTMAARVLWAAAYTAKDPIPLSLLFARAFQSTVEREATLRNIDPFLVWSIMRRESSFHTDSISVANARGLLQVVPRTGVSIAKKLGEQPPLPDELLSPEINIHLGTWYLAELYKRFGHPVTAAAAYNAGPAVVIKWLQTNGDMPLDLFVESIPYKETRGYVKQVTADLANYHALYSEVTVFPDVPLQLRQADQLGVDF